MWDFIGPDRDGILESVRNDDGIDLYQTTAYFTARTPAGGNEQITSPRIIIAVGTRTKVPDVPGLLEAGFHTTEDFFEVTELPKSMMIFGGGYKACELGMFLASFGCRTTIIGRNSRLLKNEEPEISDIVLRKSREYMDVLVNTDVTAVRGGRGEGGGMPRPGGRQPQGGPGGEDPGGHGGAEQR
jgi:pyruvate/2-oxoglutarate dehydrogenase complex dihydrolipoamide dehydrogenase (E3) component